MDCMAIRARPLRKTVCSLCFFLILSCDELLGSMCPAAAIMPFKQLLIVVVFLS